MRPVIIEGWAARDASADSSGRKNAGLCSDSPLEECGHWYGSCILTEIKKELERIMRPGENKRVRITIKEVPNG